LKPSEEACCQPCFVVGCCISWHFGKWKWWCNEMYRKMCVGFFMLCLWCHCKSSYNDFTVITCSCYSRLFLQLHIKNTLLLEPSQKLWFPFY
jgi:hypothetical protein